MNLPTPSIWQSIHACGEAVFFFTSRLWLVVILLLSLRWHQRESPLYGSSAAKGCEIGKYLDVRSVDACRIHDSFFPLAFVQKMVSWRSRFSKCLKQRHGSPYLCKLPILHQYWMHLLGFMVSAGVFELFFWLPDRGHESLDAATEMDVKKDILLERFQEEVWLICWNSSFSYLIRFLQHPGFDFRNATVNGMVIGSKPRFRAYSIRS
jgi:hypothetical protein